MTTRRRDPGRPSIAVVTDSTASLPPGIAEQWGIGVVPLDVVVDGTRHLEGVDLAPQELLDALTRGARVTTSQPPPAAFAEAYRRAAAGGAHEIVSVHLSGALSGTVQAARLAAAQSPVPVRVVDSRVVGMALGFAVVDAARLAAGSVPRTWWRTVLGSRPAAVTVDDVARHAGESAESSRVWFLVDSLDHLRRGGRLSAAAAAIGTVLGLRPLLTLRDGEVVVAEKVRTRRAARDRLEAVAVADAGTRTAVRIAVHHLGQPDLAESIGQQLRAWAADRVVEVVACESSAAIAAHAGPGLLAIVVADA